MKIIGNTGMGFILVADKQEIYQLIGWSNELEQKRNEGGGGLAVGDEIKAAEMFGQLYSLVCAKKHIDELQEVLKKVIDDLSNHPANPIIRGVHVGPDK